METWRDIPGFEGRYQVSDLGRVRSLERDEVRVRYGTPYTARRKARLLSPKRCKRTGYLHVKLSKDGRGQTHLLHRLVAQVFLPNPDNLPEVDHEDSDPGNARLSNLSWVTGRENKRRTVERGRSAKGERNGRWIDGRSLR